MTASLTGDGYADAVRWLLHSPSRNNGRDEERVPLGAYHFVTPYDTQIPFAALLDHMTHGTPKFVNGIERSRCLLPTDPPDSNTVAFCQLQNDCLRGIEYVELLQDVPQVAPSWAMAVLGSDPEALNFWMGTDESITSMHSGRFSVHSRYA